MKRIIFFLLFPFALSAQVVKDTIITIVENDTTTLIFRETTTVEGLGQVVRRVYIGATQEEAVANILTGAEGTIRTYARQAVTFATRRWLCADGPGLTWSTSEGCGLSSGTKNKKT
jgi:hypothetical protein